MYNNINKEIDAPRTMNQLVVRKIEIATVRRRKTNAKLVRIAKKH